MVLQSVHFIVKSILDMNGSKMIISHALNLTLKYQTKVLNGRKRLRKIKQTLKIA